MKIIIDCIVFSMQEHGGVSLYFSELVQHLRRNQAIDFINNYKNNNIYFKEMSLPDNDRHIKTLSLLFKRFRDENIQLKERYIFHSSYFRISKHRNAVNIVTVHDFMYEKYYPVLKRFLHSWQKKRVLRRSEGIVCVSHNTKKDLIKYHPEFADKKISVIHHGVSKEYFPIKNSPPSKIVLYVSGRKYYKNFQVVPKVMEQLSDYELILVGGGGLSRQEKSMLQHVLDRLTVVSGISNSELNVLYNKSQCLLYPSEYEGFGLPVLESMAAGCPVICQKSSSIPEITGKDYALLCNRISAEEVVKKIKALEDKEFRDKVSHFGIKQSQRFTWEGSNRKLLELYQEVYYGESTR